MKVPKRRRSREKLAQTKHHHPIRNNLISGLAVLVPVGVTIFVVKLAFDLVSGLLLPVLKFLFGEVPVQVLAPISFVIFVLLLGIVGWLARLVVGKRILVRVEAALDYIPLARNIYTSSKKVVEMLVVSERSTFKDVVLIDYPYPGVKMLGFVSGEAKGPEGRDYYKVFVPTTPNPTSGFLHLVPCDAAVILDITMEDAIKHVVSAGMLAPEQFHALPPDEGDEEELGEERPSPVDQAPLPG